MDTERKPRRRWSTVHSGSAGIEVAGRVTVEQTLVRLRNQQVEPIATTESGRTFRVTVDAEVGNVAHEAAIVKAFAALGEQVAPRMQPLDKAARATNTSPRRRHEARALLCRFGILARGSLTRIVHRVYCL